ncbi:DUF3108 domain-containing protein [Chryseolinea lacunae]|uniref:DUF3108 domain-containing protein n=1 Tax=Chryseolinea lacunae TaxID=2801331 RepID=A0ABS1KZV8_9BACT|nr:DUF3108 domain-containing protein [Chryseolinea lacunae]MBL0744202.1 DUF3108 domain-containing protein [Chryseolinea lacunae]
MKRGAFSLFIIALLSGFVAEQNDSYPPVKNHSFTRGEVINFKMTYGIFTVGKGSVNIHPKYFRINNRDCFKIDVYGKTVGMVDWVADVDDRWGAYIDTVAMIPHQFYRRIREGRYKKDEWTNFDQINHKIEVKTLDNETGKYKPSQHYDAPAQVRDMVAGFLLLRNMDLSRVKVADTISVKGFFEDQFYNFKILYMGKETIKVKAGKIRALVFKPVMPDNKVFDGENSITAWFSDDKNRIPIKINANMFIGSAGVELTDYAGLKNPLNVVQE